MVGVEGLVVYALQFVYVSRCTRVLDVVSRCYLVPMTVVDKPARDRRSILIAVVVRKEYSGRKESCIHASDFFTKTHIMPDGVQRWHDIGIQ